MSPVAGGTLLPRIHRGFRELREIGLVKGELPRIHAAQAAGCAPVVRALQEGLEFPEPVKPATIAKSIAIGNPADGFQVVRTVNATGGSGVASSDEEILQAMELLAETEGIFTEPAGGATLAGAVSLVTLRRDPVRRIRGRLYHRQRIQDGRRDDRVARRASRGDRPFAGGVRSVPAVGTGARSARCRGPATDERQDGTRHAIELSLRRDDRSGFDREDITWPIAF